MNIGTYLQKYYIEPNALSCNRLSIEIGVSATRIHEIVKKERAVTVDTDLRLCKFFGHPAGFFLRVQAQIETLEAKRRIGEGELAKIERCVYPEVNFDEEEKKEEKKEGRRQ